jgi:hypothetical protein
MTTTNPSNHMPAPGNEIADPRAARRVLGGIHLL